MFNPAQSANIYVAKLASRGLTNEQLAEMHSRIETFEELLAERDYQRRLEANYYGPGKYQK